MSLEKYFDSGYIRQYLYEIPLSNHINDFCIWLENQRYSRRTIRSYLIYLAYFNHYLKKYRINKISNIKKEHIQSFPAYYIAQNKHNKAGLATIKHISCALNKLIKYLKHAGIIDDLCKNQSAYYPYLKEYLEWLKKYKDSSDKTIRDRKAYLQIFLNWLKTQQNIKKISNLSHDIVEKFIINYFKNHSKDVRRLMQAALRTFFRFCYSSGYIKVDLAGSVPSIKSYKLSSVPKGIEEKDIKKILVKIDRNTDIGRRDYAIIMLLSTYGVRGGQVRKLCLGDINWKQNQIYFKPMKNGKRIIAPLTEDVGLSLLDYLQHSRPQTHHKEVFIISYAPYHPIYSATIITTFIKKRMEEAGIKISPCGSHTFRHGFATSMLKKGHSLKVIADMIGHRSIHSTFIYTKVDFQALKQVPLDWPEVK